MQKKWFSLLLVFTILFASMPLQAFAATAEDETAPGYLNLNKTVTPVAGTTNQWNVTLTASGNEGVTGTPAGVVVLIDRSSSMGENWACTQVTHKHSKECYPRICGKEEHKHVKSCYKHPIFHTGLKCGKVEHKHKDSCYNLTAAPICGKTVHNHTADCTRLAYAKKAAKDLVDQLSANPKAQIAVAAFDKKRSGVTVYTGSKQKNKDALVNVLQNAAAIKAAIDTISANKGTNGYAAFETTYNIFKSSDINLDNRYAVMFTDGVPDYNKYDLWDPLCADDHAKKEAKRCIDEQGIKISGVHFNSSGKVTEYLTACSNNGCCTIEKTNGIYTGISTSSQVPAATSAIVTDVVSDEFTISNLVGATVIDNTITWCPGTIGAATQSITYTITAKEGLATGRYSVGSAFIDYTNIENQTNVEKSFPEKKVSYTAPVPTTVELAVEHIYRDKNGNEVVKDSGINVVAEVGKTFDTSTIDAIPKKINGTDYVEDKRTPNFEVKAANDTIVKIFYKPASVTTLHTLTVKYVLSDGATKEDSTVPLEAGALIPVSVLQPTIEGYKFASGNYDALTKDGNDYKMPQGDAAITLNYTKNVTPPPVITKHTLTTKYVLSDGATKEDSTVPLEAGALIPVSVLQPTIDGYTFASGNYDALTKDGNDYKMPQGDAAITLNYTKNVTPPPVITKHTLTTKYVLSDGATKEDSTVPLEAGELISVSVLQPSVDGYTFASGNYDALTKDGNDYKMPQGDATVTLNYTKNVTPPIPTTEHTLTIKYVAGGTEIKASQTPKRAEGTEITADIAVPTIAGYTFASGDYSKIIKDGAKYYMPNVDATVTLTYTKDSGSSSGGNPGGNPGGSDPTPPTVPEIIEPAPVPLTPPAPTPSVPKNTEAVNDGAVPLAAPKTGEATSVLSLLGVMAVSAACITLIKKRSDEEE